MRTRPTLALLATATILLGACSDGDGDDADAAGDDAATTTAAASDGGEGTCAGTDLTYTGPGTEAFDPVSTLAVEVTDGAAYTVYIGDEEIDPGSVGIVSSPQPSADGTLVTLFVTTFNVEGEPPTVELGEPIAYSDEFRVLTFKVMSQAGETINGNNVGGSGTVTVTSLGDTFCAEVEYTDDEKSLSGTIEAPMESLM